MSNGTASIPRVPARPKFVKRGLKWSFRGLVALIIVAILLSTAIRAYNMWGLPDAPEPFDLEAFKNEVIPDSENAYTLYLKARKLMPKQRPSLGQIYGNRRDFEWQGLSTADREWLAEQQPALEIWRQATERTSLQLPSTATLLDERNRFREEMLVWSRMALLQASRLELENEPKLAEAWQWHKARLRSVLQSSGRHAFLETWSWSLLLNTVFVRIDDWAQHPKITVALLRKAIDDLQTMQELFPKESDVLKWQYLNQLSMYNLDALLDDYLNAPPVAPLTSGITNSFELPNFFNPVTKRAKSFLSSEPERSRRTMRLLFTNWIEHADSQDRDSAKVYSKRPLVFETPEGKPSLISPGLLVWHASNAPLAQIIRLDNFKNTTIPTLDDWPRLLKNDRRQVASKIIMLASRIYELETGQWPKTNDLLIGKVLPTLPNTYDEVDDSSEIAPVVEPQSKPAKRPQ
jgi:hypothetical protein